jgi:hypothetical protein
MHFLDKITRSTYEATIDLGFFGKGATLLKPTRHGYCHLLKSPHRFKKAKKYTLVPSPRGSEY